MRGTENMGDIAHLINKSAFVKSEKIINEDNGEIINKRATFDLSRLEKGAEAEIWSTVAYNVPVMGDRLRMLSAVQTKIENTRGSDLITFPTLSQATPEIVLEGGTSSGSVSAQSPGAVEIATKNYVKSYWSLTLKQQASMSFNFMAAKIAQQKIANYRTIEKSAQRILALLVPSAHRQERATGDGMTLALFENAYQYLLDDAADETNLATTMNAATLNKIKAIAEGTSNRLMFLDWSYSQNNALKTGQIPSVEGFEMLMCGQLPGLEDDWSAIEATETHLTQLLFDKRSVAIGIDAMDDILILPTTSGNSGYEYVMQTYYGAGALNTNHLAAIKMYEA